MIGRKKELCELERRFASGKFELGIVYGPRRIGKSTLLHEFIKEKNGFMFQAKETDFSSNLNSLSRAFRKFSGKDDRVRYESIEDVFDDLIRYSEGRRMVFVIDEFPYLAKNGKGIVSMLQEYVDRFFPLSNILLILSGSSVSFMKELLEEKTSALYKRETFKIELGRMRIEETLPFFEGVNLEERGNYLSLFSTYPYYLSMIGRDKTFEENLLDLVFSPFGILLDAPNNVMPAGSQNNKMFNSILCKISKRKTSSKDLSDSLHLDSNYLSTYLKQLLGMGLIEKKEMFKSGKKFNYYGIADPFLDFYYRFIFDYADIISLGGGEAYYHAIEDDLAAYLGFGFERLANQYMNEMNLSGRLGHFYGLIQNYKVENSKLGRSIEIDGIAETVASGPKSLMVIESKYRNKALSLKILEHLKESVSVFGDYQEIDYYLISKKGFSDDLISMQDPHIHLIDMQEMLGSC